MTDPRPILVQSRCLNLGPARWNGVVIDNRFAAALAPARGLLRALLLRIEHPWALSQRWFDPFPEELMAA